MHQPKDVKKEKARKKEERRGEEEEEEEEGDEKIFAEKKRRRWYRGQEQRLKERDFWKLWEEEDSGLSLETSTFEALTSHFLALFRKKWTAVEALDDLLTFFNRRLSSPLPLVSLVSEADETYRLVFSWIDWLERRAHRVTSREDVTWMADVFTWVCEDHQMQQTRLMRLCRKHGWVPAADLGSVDQLWLWFQREKKREERDRPPKKR